MTPSRASMDTVNFVPKSLPLARTISGRSSCSQRSRDIGMQIRPRPKRAMKLIASGVTCSAAITRSPSFSRSCVVHQDHHLALTDVLDQFFNAVELHETYLLMHAARAGVCAPSGDRRELLQETVLGQERHGHALRTG